MSIDTGVGFDQLQAQLGPVRRHMRKFERELAQGFRHTANATQELLRRHPWMLLAALGALILGMVLARRAS